MDEPSEGNRPEIDRLRHRSPGTDLSDPYENVDVSELPEWWRRAIREFENHHLRPYRPPRFQDGTPKHEVVKPLERELDVEISFGCLEPERGSDWTVYVDSRSVGTLGHRRSPDGYSVFEMESDDFETLVRDAVAGGG